MKRLTMNIAAFILLMIVFGLTASCHPLNADPDATSATHTT